MSLSSRVAARSGFTGLSQPLHMLIANRINDSVMELLIMISACKGGSAKSVTGTEVLISCSASH